MKVSDLIDFRKENGFYPDNAVAVTFDDGFKSFYDLALPVLRKHSVPATIYVCPKLTDEDSWIWPDCVSYLYRQGYYAHSQKSLDQLLMEMKKMTTSDRDKMIRDLARLSKVPIPDVIPEEHRLMTWEMLRELAHSTLVEIGSHSLSHPILAMEDADTSWREISESKNRLQEMLGIPINSFCFPNGRPGDFKPEHLEMLRKAEYQSGLAANFGFITSDSNDMALPRIEFSNSMFANYKQLDGVEYLQLKLSKELYSYSSESWSPRNSQIVKKAE